MKNKRELYIASCTKDGGAYRYTLTDDGMLSPTGKIPMDRPMFIQIEGQHLHAILLSPFPDSNESGAAIYNINTGEHIGKTISTQGVECCHIAVSDNEVYCANYGTGSIIKLPDTLISHIGHGCNMSRQEAPHIHSVIFSPDKKYIISCDLGLDTVFVYDRELNYVSSAKVPDGEGARHIVFSRDGKCLFCVNEMGSSVTTFAYNNDKLTMLSTKTALPDGFTGTSNAAAIKISKKGDRLYVTNRGADTIAAFSVDGPELTLLSQTDCCGKGPRDFSLLMDDKFAICTNQFSDSFALYRISGDKLDFIKNYSLPRPLCVIEDE